MLFDDIFKNKNRKNIRENFINKLDNLSFCLHEDRNIRGYLVCFIHILLVSIPFFIVMFSNKIKLMIISQIILVLILLQHFYFDGCWMIRLERKIWNTKEWYGLWTYLFKIIEDVGIKLNRHSRDYIFFIVYSVILSIGFYRILKYL